MPAPIQLERLALKKKPADVRVLLFLILLLCLVAGFGWMRPAATTAPPAPTEADMKKIESGKRACPGMHAAWLDDTTVQCLKEKP